MNPRPGDGFLGLLRLFGILDVLDRLQRLVLGAPLGLLELLGGDVVGGDEDVVDDEALGHGPDLHRDGADGADVGEGVRL